MTSVSEDVHQRAGQNEEEGQQLQKMGVVAVEHPGHGCGQTQPQQPLVDAGPVRAALTALSRFI
ncbi:hypothetical protein [Roseateles puraquae]|uniref:hypothetical protein n=1 Tax=Roseateles puraquae TaxID=431059 RepID=UPI003B967AFD